VIVTVTANPSIDRTVVLDDLVVGTVNRGRRSWSEPSGKGVNVALALHAHDVPVRAVVVAGGAAGALLRDMLRDTGLDTTIVPIAGEIRTNVSLTLPDGSVTKVNEPGPTVSEVETDRLVRAVEEAIGGAAWLVCAGSLPAGMPTDWYAHVVELGHRNGIRVAVDGSGTPIAEALRARPDLVKPNVHELAELTGATLHTIGDVVDAAREIRARGADTVLASLGADGAILVTGDQVLWGRAHVPRVTSTVGAGDATLAGWFSGPTANRDRFMAALRWGAIAVQHVGTLFTTRGFEVAVDVTDAPDGRQPLRERG
jgi:1-phosphofructokinase